VGGSTPTRALQDVEAAMRAADAGDPGAVRELAAKLRAADPHLEVAEHVRLGAVAARADVDGVSFADLRAMSDEQRETALRLLAVSARRASGRPDAGQEQAGSSSTHRGDG